MFNLQCLFLYFIWTHVYNGYALLLSDQLGLYCTPKKLINMLSIYFVQYIQSERERETAFSCHIADILYKIIKYDSLIYGCVGLKNIVILHKNPNWNKVQGEGK